MKNFVDIDYKPNYNRTDNELEAFLCFSICVAGKNADTTKNALISFFDKWHEKTKKKTPFEIIKSFSNLNKLGQALKEEGVGCYTKRAEYLTDLANSNMDLRKCSAKDFEKIKGIGPKTARFIILFSRSTKKEYAILDTHILKWLDDLGFDVPSTTPGSSKKYDEIEKLFIKQYEKYASSKMNIADFDYILWQQMRGDIEKVF